MRFQSKPVFVLAAAALMLNAGCSSHDEAGKPGSPVVENEWGLKNDEMAAAPSAQVAATAPASGDMDTRMGRLEKQVAEIQGDMTDLLPPLADMAKSGQKLDTSITAIQERQRLAAARNMAEYRTVAIAPSKQMLDAAPTSREKPIAMEAPPVPVEPVAKGEPLSVAPPPPPFSAEEAQAQAPVSPPIGMVEERTAGTSQPVQEIEVATSAPVLEDAAAPAATEPAVSSDINVTDVRVGEHPGKTRIVLDMSGPVQYSYNIDNNEKLLIVELPGAGWTGDAQKALKSPLIKSYSAQKSASGSGTTLAIELSQPSKVMMATAMKANGASADRIVLDVGAL